VSILDNPEENTGFSLHGLLTLRKEIQSGHFRSETGGLQNKDVFLSISRLKHANSRKRLQIGILSILTNLQREKLVFLFLPLVQVMISFSQNDVKQY